MNPTPDNSLTAKGNHTLRNTLGQGFVSAPFVNNPRNDLRGAALPALQEIPAGFDAIFQFHSSLLEVCMGRNTAATTGTLYTEIDYDKSNLPQPVWDELKCRIEDGLNRGANGSLSVTIPAVRPQAEDMLGNVLDSLPSLHLIITVEDTREPRTKIPRIAFDLSQPANHAQVRWRIIVEALVPTSMTSTTTVPQPSFSSTIDSLLENQEPGIPPEASFPISELQRVLISWGEATTTAELYLAILAATFQVTAQLDFSNANVDARALNDYLRCSATVSVQPVPGADPSSNPPTLFAALLHHDNQLLDAIRAAFMPLIATSKIDITPKMALGAGNTLQRLGAFHVRAVATQGNTLLGPK